MIETALLEPRPGVRRRNDAGLSRVGSLFTLANRAESATRTLAAPEASNMLFHVNSLICFRRLRRATIDGIAPAAISARPSADKIDRRSAADGGRDSH